nr:UDP-N-acetylglucosamine 1-carboxyvinyltransferase [uncultured Eisenbergiella sp.]
MKSIYISGNAPLYGEATIQGSKNAALPIMAAALLIPGISVLKNCPHIADVEYMCRILETIGCIVEWDKNEVRIDATAVKTSRLPEEYVTMMRSSVMLMGPMLGRIGEVSLHYPGGCVIGDRPIDIHLKALERLGVRYSDSEQELEAQAFRLTGTDVSLEFPSVGATENLIMAAAAAEGITRIQGSALEPEIVSLCAFLRTAGADIRGEETGCITVAGGRKLHPCCFTIPSDRIVAGTYICACLAAGGEIFLKNSPPGQLTAMEDVAVRMGCRLRRSPEGLFLQRRGVLFSPGFVETRSYPGFPTDLQSPLLVALSLAEGESALRETIFNGRFGVVDELNKMGTDIVVRKDTACIPGSRRLSGHHVTASELRGGAALVVAGLCAEGMTEVENRYFIDRGYEDICRDLSQLGADIDSW